MLPRNLPGSVPRGIGDNVRSDPSPSKDRLLYRGGGGWVSKLSQAQRDHKRAHDRNAQRASRQRTKQYIESLEARLQELSGLSIEETGSQLARERQRHTELTKEVAELKVKAALPLDTTSLIPEDDLIGVPNLPGPVFNVADDMSAINMTSFTHVHPPEFGSVSYPSMLDTAVNSGPLGIQDMLVPTFATADTWTTHIPSLIASDAFAVPPSFIDQPLPYRHAIPALVQPQRVDTRLPDDQTTVDAWEVANSVFASADHVARAQTPADHEQIPWQNILIRGIMEGWDSVDHIVGLSPIWQQIRLVEEVICKDFGVLERLAPSWVMYLRLNYLSNPTPENEALVPPWYLHSPSPTGDDLQAAYFMVWPGLRELLKYSPARLSSDAFWRLITLEWKIIWPYEIRDCYRRNTITDTYEISPTFEQTLYNLQCWGAGAEVFNQFPEIRGTIFCPEEIPTSLAGTPVAQFNFAVPKGFTYAKVVKRKSRWHQWIPDNRSTAAGRSANRMRGQATEAQKAPGFGYISPQPSPASVNVSTAQISSQFDRWGSVSDARFVDVSDQEEGA